jgi:D-sedoheptulose 7-phosphate isomerase
LSVFSDTFLAETAAILDALERDAIERMAAALTRLRDAGGRLFILGVGGSAAHASHAVNDFRKVCGLEAYAPTDNVSELTARINDDGWEGSLSGWLRGSRLARRDAVLVFSVGGGSRERQVSTNLVAALELAREVGAHIYGIVGREGGVTAQWAEEAIVIPPLFPDRVTPHTEAVCAVLWHLLVSHPCLSLASARWESLTGSGR